MKRKIVIVASLALAVAGYGVAQLWAQPGAGGAANIKIGVLNMDAVFAKYNKALKYKKELDDMIAPYKGEAEKIKKSMKEIQDYVNHPKADPKLKEQYERAALDYRRKLEDLDRDVRKLIGKKQEEQLMVLYKEIALATQAYAQSNGFHMVLGHMEPFETQDLVFSVANISRKMQGMNMGIVPIWFHGSLDVTDGVIGTLNHQAGNITGNPVVNPGKN